jgi:Uma2 family endonuclease
MAVLTELTIEDFEQLPDALAYNHELVDGELVDVSGNTRGHIRLRDFLLAKLLLHVEERNLGEVVAEQEYDFNGNAHGPDISFVSRDRVPVLDTHLRVQRVVPDLAIEISSRNDRLETTMTKLDRYRRCGTKETWLLIIPTRRAIVSSDRAELILNENDDFHSDLIPGSSIRLKDLFDRA